MSNLATIFRLACLLLAIAVVSSNVLAQDRRGEPNILASGYYVVDSYEDAGTPWQTLYNFLDTSYQPVRWKRIKSGPRQNAPAGHFFYNPLGWSDVSKMDTTDNTMAGPIPLGFKFNYYGIDYDSVYISSNGFIGFRPYSEAAGNPVGGQSSYMASQNKDFANSSNLSSAPPSIIAGMWADLTFFKKDSSKVFVYTNAAADTFIVNFYNLRLKPGSPNVGEFQWKGGDRLGLRKMQIILTKKDSSIQINYSGFTGTYGGSNPIPASKSFQYSSAIGLVNHLRNQSTAVLFKNTWQASNPNCSECNKDLSQSGGWALKFKQWKNVVRAVKVEAPVNNSELCLGASAVALKAVVRNVSNDVQSFQALMSIRNAVNGKSLYSQKVSINNLTPLKDSSIAFPGFTTDASNSDHFGKLTITAVAIPITPGNVSLGDMWPFDDTVTSTVFGIKRLSAPFRDVATDYSVSSGVAIPNHQKWTSLGAEVVEGDDKTFDPPAPRDFDGQGWGPFQYRSPVIRLDRKSERGIVYAVGGDTLSTLPVNLQGVTQAEVTFNYHRGNRRNYEWPYDFTMLHGPEHTILNSSGGIVQRGDSLILEFKKPTEPGCNPSANGWTRIAAVDGGKDLEFKNFRVKIEDFNKGINYFSADFRARLRLKAKHDGTGLPSLEDEEDAWYVDNFTIQVPQEHDLQVVWTRAVTSYTKMPASQAVLPVYVNVVNHSRSSAVDVPIVTQIRGPGGPVYYEVKKFTILSGDTVLRMPDWDARNATYGNGTEHYVQSWIGISNYDSYTQDNGTYSVINLNIESEGSVTQEFAYDDAGLNPQPNDGNDWPGVMQVPGQGIGFNSNSGSFAMKFNLARTDTLYGVRVYFGNGNAANDAIRIALFDGTPNGAVPGDSVKISGAASAFNDERKGDFFNKFWPYYFPKPLVLPGPDQGDDGFYWISVSQLSLDRMMMGADVSRGGATLLVKNDASPVSRLIHSSPYGTQYESNANAGDITNRLAVETTAGSKNWAPMTAQAVGGIPAGIVIPMIRPLMSRIGILPVEYAKELKGEEINGDALLTWTTANELNNMGFFVERMSTQHNLWEKINFVESKLTNSNNPIDYTFVDKNVDIGTYSYRLIQTDLDGSESVSNVVQVQIGESGVLPEARNGFGIRQSHPNPFDPSKGSMRFIVASPEQVSAQIVIYNTLGQAVRSLGTFSLTSSYTDLTWDGKDDGGVMLANGTYILQVTNGDTIDRCKIHLSR